MALRSGSITKLAAVTCVLAMILAGCEEPGTGTNATKTAGTSQVQTANSDSGNTGTNTVGTEQTDQSATQSDVPESSGAEQQSTLSTGGETQQECANLTGQEALETYIHAVPKPFPPDRDPGENYWSMNSSTDTYDPCAEMSWIVLGIDRATASSPYQVMLFHKGVYVGRATDQAFGFAPVSVERVDDDDIIVTFRYGLEGESNAESSGRVSARYSWDPTLQRLDRYGDVPPGSKFGPG